MALLRDSNLSQYCAIDMPEEPKRRTRTSLNTLKHGCRSRQFLLPHEDPNDWMKLRDKYVAQYDPQTPFILELLEDTVRAHWFLQRNQSNFYLTQADLPEDPREWTAEDHHQIALFSRYQTTAERTFNRALGRLTSFHKDYLAQHDRQQKTEAPTPKTAKQTKSEPTVIEQWVEVRKIDNSPVTQFYPSNEEMEQRIKTAQPTPQLVYRRLFFPDGVPIQYQWTRPRKGQSANGGLAMQRMTVETWLSLREKERETGHAVSTGQPTLRDWRDQS
ncbi:MAG TPA: hypothetical protein VH325_12760 [Bryobacteraceae bacterium]|jgi:hypothetical protein|nr:hypothetical protein [Bryobacteraceae bacterium]